MKGINLLPWRLEKYRQSLILFLFKMFAVLLIAFLCYAVLDWFQHQQKAALNLQLQQFEQQKNRLTQTLQKVGQMKQIMQDLTELHAIDPELVEQILSLLPQFPLQQGELEHFSFNEDGIRIDGFCLSQQEFESLHEFLSRRFSSVKLMQFKTEQGRLIFQFDLSSEMVRGGK
ncbi:PilN domain-containing protein [Rodentibacter trehalosifermentans]|uniref:Competence protein ComB n=1 Tax=Rodentibacter trehalosifermentans TaxID=1908263 RepID=A0A1V3IPU6_9PAST|nr:hypothetical protein [Rodentibacter trehalosifermentans]OOF44292.1 hypothetical protein BKK51_09315 [Rodentibacter trehalosifermentans]OOF52203.1 hypothetical protein BKK53_06660 [Rodentibacter trehalosifermentans]